MLGIFSIMLKHHSALLKKYALVQTYIKHYAPLNEKNVVIG